MKTDVTAHEAGDEEVAVIVARLAPDRRFVTRFCTCGFQQVQPQLLLEEFVGQALVDQQG